MREKKSKCQKKNFFFQLFLQRMNDKRNLICGNMMLLSQSRDEISLSIFCKKKIGLRSKKKINFDLGAAG